MELPLPLVDRARRARVILELGAGARFDVALALAAAAPDARVIVSDVDARVLAAPSPLVARIVDAHAPDLAALDDVDLVVAVRIPEELQAAATRLANALDADLAMKPLKDEWADVTPFRRRAVAWPHGWRYFPRTAP